MLELLEDDEWAQISPQSGFWFDSRIHIVNGWINHRDKPEKLEEVK